MKTVRSQGLKGFVQKGFTLVELAIVLVIAGIILVGVLKGTDSINKAKVERMVADLKGLQGSVLEFQKRNNRMPGDCNNNGVIELAVSAVSVAGVDNVLDKVQRNPQALAVCGQPDSTSVVYHDDLWSGGTAAGGTGPLIASGVVGSNLVDAFNLPWNEMRHAGIVDGNRTNEELGRHMFNDIYALGSISDSTTKANVIVVYGIPVWMAEALDAELDGVAASYGDNSISGPACTGRVRLWANSTAIVGAGGANTAGNNVVTGQHHNAATAADVSTALFNDTGTAGSPTGTGCKGQYGTDRDALVSISYQYDTMKLVK